MILVTGCSGFVGSHLVRMLADQLFDVRCLARGKHGLENLPQDRVSFVEGDVTRLETLLEAMEGISTVVHLVGIIRENDNQTFERVHIQGTQNVIDAASTLGAHRIIYQSALGANELGVTRYFRTKWQAEELVRNSGLEWIINRPSIIIGKRGGFVRILVDLVQSRSFIPVIGSGGYKLQPIYITDFGRAFVKMLRDSSCWGKTYEFGGPERLDFDRMLDITQDALGIHKRKIHLPVWLMKPIIGLMEAALPNPPITLDELAMLSAASATDNNALGAVFGVRPTPFGEALRLSL